MTGIKDKYEKYFKIGTAVNVADLSKHTDIVKNHFNYLTCENEMKHNSFCTEEGIYRFSWPDIINDFAKKNNMPIHGHVFVWHQQTPEYIFTSNPTREQMLTCLRLHIKVVGNRYKDTIDSWDVLNEVIDDKYGKFYRDTKFRRIIGDDYADCIFRMAKEILPNSLG